MRKSKENIIPKNLKQLPRLERNSGMVVLRFKAVSERAAFFVPVSKKSVNF
jgi:hypothetical protein